MNDQHRDSDPEQGVDEPIDGAADHDPCREQRGQEIHRELDRRARGVGAQRQRHQREGNERQVEMRLQHQQAETLPIDRNVQQQQDVKQQPRAAEQRGLPGPFRERDALDEIEQEIDAAEHHHQISVQKDLGSKPPSADH
ncbi:hypothetical protein [Bradyrhizobium sp. JR3.5]